MGLYPKLSMAAVVLLAAIYIGFTGFIKYKHSQELEKVEKKYVGKIAPDVLRPYFGKKIILIFWTTWSKESKKEIEVVNSLYDEMKDGELTQIISVVMDEKIDNDDLKEFVETYEIKYKVLFDENNKGANNPIAKEFDILGIPSVWVIDKDGKVLVQNLQSIFHIQEYLKVKL